MDQRIGKALPPRLASLLRGVRDKVFPGLRRKRIFTDIHRTNFWQGNDSLSGTGSGLEQTEVIRRDIPRLITQVGITSILDAPCGDFRWMRECALGDCEYIGADIVPDIIAENTRRFAGERRRFLVADVSADRLPQVDLILCRDCLVHLSFADAAAVLANFQRSGSRYLLTTHFTDRKTNRDISTGEWRPLNLRLPPFSLPLPLGIIVEQCTEMDGIYSDKALALWRVDDLGHW